MKKTNHKEKNKIKKSTGCKTKWLILGILTGLFALAVLFVLLIPKILFTDYEGLPVTGEYEVKEVAAILTDESRVETFETDGSNREVPVHFFYPVASDAKEDSFPLVIFSHGAFGYYQSNMSTYMELASHGYVVISMDHPYHSFFTTDTSGKTVTVNPTFIQDVMRANGDDITEEEVMALSQEWLSLRLLDMNFVLDTVKEAKEAGGLSTNAWFVADGESDCICNILSMTDTERIGSMGHSMGGASSVTLGRIREDINAVVDLDGTMLGERVLDENGEVIFYEDAYPVAMLFISNEAHHLEREKAGSLYVNNEVLENALESHYTYFIGSGHMNFTDLPLFSPPLASLLGVGEVDATECIVTMNEIILQFFDCYLKGEGEFVAEESY